METLHHGKKVTTSRLKMHWTPEHAQSLNQWPEQHLDVSSTTSSPAHKPEVYPSSRQRYNYAWANDDISALTASNLLKRYAEKYSGVLDSAYERPGVTNYTDGTFGPLNGQKGDLEPWQMTHSAESPYSLNAIHDGLTSSKPAVSSTIPPGGGPPGIGSSALVASNLAEPSYVNSACGGHSSSIGLGVSQDYSSGYNGTYLASGYCSQPPSALPATHAPPPPPLHGSGLLQPAHPPQALVPGYSSSATGYNYSSNSYPPQPGIGPSYGGVHPPGSYLSSGIAAPTPLPPSRPPLVPSYSYQCHSLAPVAVPSFGGDSANSLKRKAFDMAGEEDGDRYRKYNYEQQKSSESPYQMPDENITSECRGNGFTRLIETPQVAFKPGKRPIGEEHAGKFGSPPMKTMVSPTYSAGDTPLRSNDAFSPPVINGERGSNDHGPTFAQRLQVMGIKPSTSCIQSEEQLKNMDPHVVELVNSEIIECGSPVQWTDIIGQVAIKAVIEEELVWPVLRPGAYTGVNRPPRTILLFGPRGGGKTLLSKCIATQLGATFLRISGTSLLSKWKGEAEKILRTIFLIAGCRQPSVIFISEIDSLLSACVTEESGLSILKSQLLSYLDTIASSSGENVIIIGATQCPQDLDENAHRCFTRCFYIAPPDSIARRQLLHHALAQQNYCLSEREMVAIVQHTEGYSGSELAQLCQQAAAVHLHGMGGQLQPTCYKDFENALRKVQPGVSQKELDLYIEWNKVYGSRQ
ncbi:fidgetin-like protein 2 [Protopterus annectens]|uniref:fidgetin-like protein 2 n=1 Tax=Protopterus annectens TaxID=7888 RepID=UPI001CF9E36E|nr:fidgetin-like protein 2 [Protopterus annectens]